MTKALYFSTPLENRINPTIGLVTELVKQGHQIVYFTGKSFRKQIEHTGAEFRPIPKETEDLLQSIIADPSFQELQKTGFTEDILDKIMTMFQLQESITDFILKDIKDEQYDYVLHDAQGLPGKLIANTLNLPTISTWTTFAPSDKAPIQNNNQKKTSIFALLKETAPIRKHLEQKYKVNLHENLMLCYGDMNICFTSKTFQKNAEKLADQFVFVGPSIADRFDETEFPFDQIRDQRVVLMSMGSILQNQPELYQIAFEALKDIEAKVVVSIGKNLSFNQLKKAPKNFIIQDYVPQLEILQYADVFITHSGLNSVSESLYFEVPLVMIPIRADQPAVAKRIEELGAGIRLDVNKISPQQLKEAVLDVLYNPIYKENGKIISQSFKTAGGYVKAAESIIQFVNRKQKD
ncbi:macrolide family glycosyltransferase [Shimazuella kribbensis]|uniref:macrolide family glycosyltransferase n=1 Tax=Shimazuella kribbensis TaxID=139808 RepID=UPI0004180C4A|nr:macrolide family glycosyltransferase [Shimazuella kribbensis]